MPERTDQPRTCTDASPASVTVTALHPRPAPPSSAFNPDDTEVAEKVASWWQHAEQFLGGEPLDHHANHCFSDAVPAGAA